jgi:hypothetical protein
MNPNSGGGGGGTHGDEESLLLFSFVGIGSSESRIFFTLDMTDTDL